MTEYIHMEKKKPTESGVFDPTHFRWGGTSCSTGYFDLSIFIVPVSEWYKKNLSCLEFQMKKIVLNFGFFSGTYGGSKFCDR